MNDERAHPEASPHWHKLALLLPASLMLLGLWLAPEPAALPAVSDARRESIGRAQRLREPGMRAKAMKRFAADPWSQDDEFAHAEAGQVRRYSAQFGASPSSVLGAIDADVRAHPNLAGRPEGERGAVSPCMPRVFYR